MKTLIYLKEVKPENLLVAVDLEVVPRGIYEIDGKPYQYVGQPKFTIKTRHGRLASLEWTELVVEPING